MSIFSIPGRAMLGAAAVLAVVIALTAARLWLDSPRPNLPDSVPVSAETFEDKWGVRFTRVAVTADGGMVDVRYQVVDADKATLLTSDEAHLPVLQTESSGKVVNSAALMPNHYVEAGRTYFVLYRNTDGAITPGTSVSVVLAGQRLEHLVAN